MKYFFLFYLFLIVNNSISQIKFTKSNTKTITMEARVDKINNGNYYTVPVCGIYYKENSQDIVLCKATANNIEIVPKNNNWLFEFGNNSSININFTCLCGSYLKNLDRSVNSNYLNGYQYSGLQDITCLSLINDNTCEQIYNWSQVLSNNFIKEGIIESSVEKNRCNSFKNALIKHFAEYFNSTYQNVVNNYEIIGINCENEDIKNYIYFYNKADDFYYTYYVKINNFDKSKISFNYSFFYGKIEPNNKDKTK